MRKQQSGRGSRWLIALAVVTSGLNAHGQQPAAPATGQGSTAVGQGGWLSGTVDEKFETVAGQLRGFDMAMVETGYRYVELHWAAQDGNWDYAAYQAGKIRTAIESGLKRRPLRAKSAEPFLTNVLPSVEDAIKQRNAGLLKERMGTLVATCNSCHAAEKVAFIKVSEPQTRTLTSAR